MSSVHGGGASGTGMVPSSNLPPTSLLLVGAPGTVFVVGSLLGMSGAWYGPLGVDGALFGIG